MKSVEELYVFKLAHQLTLRIYKVTEDFPKEETFSIVTQTRRAAGSVGMNKDFGYISSETYKELRSEYDGVGKMLFCLSASLDHEKRARTR